MLAPEAGDAPREPDAIKEGLPAEQLYDMNIDEEEQHNVAADHPEVVKELSALLQKYIEDGRSTSGPKQTNDVPIMVHKKPARSAAEEAKNGD